MPQKVVRIAGVVFAVAMLATACSDGSDYEYVDPASVEEIGDNLWRIELTERAVARTQVETTEVAMHDVDGTERLVVPYSAVMYHFDGSTWTYTNPEPLVYVREAISIDHIDGDVAVLDDGPSVGTVVVTVGAAELYGVEFGIGK